MASITNHYHQGSNKCFMEVTVTGTLVRPNPRAPAISRTVFDAFEGKTYADYYWVNNKGEKYWEVSPLMCKVTTLQGEEVHCKTTEEYEALIKQFMGQ